MSQRQLTESLEALHNTIEEARDAERLRRLAAEGDPKAAREHYRNQARQAHTLKGSGIILPRYRKMPNVIRTIRTKADEYYGRKGGIVRFAAPEALAKTLADEASITLVQDGQTENLVPIWMTNLNRKGAQHETDYAFELLQDALRKHKLPTERGRFRKAGVDEFMYMGKDRTGQYMFKHIKTRNYLYVHKSGRLVIPRGGAFHMGFFDA